MNNSKKWWLIGTGSSSPPITYENLIDSASLSALNEYVDVTFLFGVYHSTGGAVVASDLSISFSANGGTATNASIASITNTSGGALAGGEITIRVNLTITGSASGVETITITPSAQGTIKDTRDIYISGSDTTGAILLNYTYNDIWATYVQYLIDNSIPLPTDEELIIGSDKMDLLEAEGAFTSGFEAMFLYFSTKKLMGLVNVMSPGDDATQSGSPTWTSHSGWRSGGGGYINTNFIPNNASLFLAADASSWVGINNDANANAIISTGVAGNGGGDANQGNISFSPENNAGNAGYALNGTTASITTTPNSVSTGLYVTTINTNLRLYKDGTQLKTAAAGATARSTLAVYDTCKNANGTAGSFDTIHDINFRAFGSAMESILANCSSIIADWITEVKALAPDTSPPAPGPGGVNRLFMIAGQSNADGRGLVSALPGYLTGALNDCYIWNGADWEVLEAGENASNAYPSLRHGVIVSLAYEQRALYPDDILYFINAGIGGTTLHIHWVPVTGDTYIQAKAQFDAVIATGTTFTKHALIWWQGEGDTDFPANATAYEANEQALMDQFDTDFAFANKICINISGNTTDMPEVATVRAAKVANAAALYYTLIDSDPYNPTSIVHIPSAGLVSIGEDISAIL